MTDTTPHLDERLRRPAGIRSLTLGDTKLTYVPDGQATLNARMLLPQATEEDWAQHAGYLDEDGFLLASVGGLLVERGGRALLIDAAPCSSTPGRPADDGAAGEHVRRHHWRRAAGQPRHARPRPRGHRAIAAHPPAHRPLRVGLASRPRQRPARLQRRLPGRRTRVEPASLRRSAGHGRHDQGPGAAGAHRGRGRGDLPRRPRQARPGPQRGTPPTSSTRAGSA